MHHPLLRKQKKKENLFVFDFRDFRENLGIFG
jgi:hypothetical protein